MATNSHDATSDAIKLATIYTKDAINRQLLGTKTDLYGLKRRKGAITGTTTREIFG